MNRLLTELADLSEIDKETRKGLTKLYKTYKTQQPYKKQIAELNKQISEIYEVICSMHRRKLYLTQWPAIKELIGKLHEFESKKGFFIWRGSGMDALIGLINLSTRHKETVCSIFPLVNFKAIKNLRELRNFISFLWTCGPKEVHKLVLPRKFSKILKYCEQQNKDFVIYPLSLQTMDPKCKTKEFVSHANYLIFNTKERNVIRYDPLGLTGYIANVYDIIALDKSLKKTFKKKFGYKYIIPWRMCPLVIGIQAIQSSEVKRLPVLKKKIPSPLVTQGFCSAWALWFVDVYLSNPHIPPAELERQEINKFVNMRKQFQTTLTQFIYEYVNELSEIKILIDIKKDDTFTEFINKFAAYIKKIGLL